ncbi:MAG: (d)CMP kinase [Proteobacteria bacterium]|nr:(d)CMP kinase [Pseudomonadota bacterium]
MVVAIDGPSGVGKSTVSRRVAKELGARYIDTGAMYRAVALGLSDEGIKVDNVKGLDVFLNAMEFSFEGELVLLNDVDMTQKIREAEAGELASKYASLTKVRRRLVEMQRDYAKSGSVVMEGRDITTVVLPKADFKFFLTASPEVRAKRRLADEKSTDNRNIEEVAGDINARDERDSTRKDSPLKKAEDAIEIDTGLLSIDGVVEKIMGQIKERGL